MTDLDKEIIKIEKKHLFLVLGILTLVISGFVAYSFFSSSKNNMGPTGAAISLSEPDLFPTEKLSFNQAVGKQAPDFSLESIDGKTIKLSDYIGRNVVLFFNEGGMCYPSCWDQIAALGNDERFNNKDVVAFSIVVGQKSEWKKIIRQVPKLSKAKILFDTTRAVSSAYDVLSLPSSMHPGSYPGHTYFIIDKKLIVRYVFDDPKMAIRNDMLISELAKFGGE